MKKLIALLLAAIMVLSLAACASSPAADQPANDQTTADTTTTEETKTEEKTEDTAASGDVEVVNAQQAGMLGGLAAQQRRSREVRAAHVGGPIARVAVEQPCLRVQARA